MPIVPKKDDDFSWLPDQTPVVSVSPVEATAPEPVEDDFSWLPDQEEAPEPNPEATYLAGADLTPEQSLEILNIQKQTGLPESFIYRNLDSMKRGKARAEYDDFRRLNPKTGAWIAESPTNLALAKDDLDNLGQIDDMLTTAALAPRAFVAGMNRISPATYGWMEQASAMLPEAIGETPREFWKRQRQQAEEFNKTIRGDQSKVGHYGQVALGGVESMGAMLPAVVASILTKNPNVGLGIMGGQASGEAFGQGADAGINAYQNLSFGLSQGAIEVATEKIPFGWLLKDIGAKAPLFSLLKRQLMGEIPGEQIATLMQDFNEWVTLHPEKPASAYIAERPQAGVDTLIATIVATAGMGGIGYYAGKLGEDKQTNADKDFFKALGDVAKKSKTRKRSPEHFQKAVSRLTRGGTLENVYMPVETWDTYWQEQGVDPAQMAQELTGDPETYNQAVESGEPLKLSTDAYITKIAPTEHNAFFAEELRSSPVGMSAREFVEFKASPEFYESPPNKQERVDYMTEQLVATGMDKETAQVQAEALYGDMFDRIAERAGVDPAVMWQQMKVRVGTGQARGQVVDKDGVIYDQQTGQIVTETPEAIAEELRIVYNGKWEGTDLHQYTDVRTGGSFSVKGTPTVENVIEALNEKRREFGEPEEYEQSAPLSVDEFVAKKFYEKTGATVEELEGEALEHINEMINEGYVDGEEFTFKRLKLFGSFYKGTNKRGSDLDIAVEYEGTMREDDAHSMLNERVMAFRNDKGKLIGKVDFTPTKAGKSGTLDEFLEGQLTNEEHTKLMVEEYEQSAYHGTPHKFDKFTLDHIGKGEGAQAYGWGLYFAENKDVAQWYREKLTETGLQDPPLLLWNGKEYRKIEDRRTGKVGAEYHALSLIHWSGGRNIREIRKETAEWINQFHEGQPWALEMGLEYLERVHEVTMQVTAKATVKAKHDPQSGSLIKVALPEKEEFLDWDKPLSEQSEKVWAALETAPLPTKGDYESLEREILQSAKKHKADIVEVKKAITHLKEEPLDTKARPTGWAWKVLSDAVGEDVDLNQFHDIQDRLELPKTTTGQGVHGYVVGVLAGGTKNDVLLSDAMSKLGVTEQEINQHPEMYTSLYLKSIGIPGIKYLEGASRAKGEGHHNFVVFDEELIEIEEYLQKKGKRTVRGRIQFTDEGVNIDLLKKANLSTFIHETGHYYLKILETASSLETASLELKADYAAILDWLGAKPGEKLTTAQHEKFARGFEAYLRNGRAPSVKMRSAFEKFKIWLTDVYKSLSDLNVELTPEVIGVFDRLFATPQEIAEAGAENAVIDMVVEGSELETVTPEEVGEVTNGKPVPLPSSMGYISGDKALSVTWTKAKKAARAAYKAGKTEEADKWKAKMQEVVAKAKAKVEAVQTEKQKMAKRRKTIQTIVDYMGLTDPQVKKLLKKDLRLMSDYEFKKFKDDLFIKAEAVQENAFAKARVMDVIERKRLQQYGNLRKAMGLPPVNKMTTEQLNLWADTLEEFSEGDTFLTLRQLETVDNTDLAGVRTWREARTRLAERLGVPIETLDEIKPGQLDSFRWDTALADQNPFYSLMVEDTLKSLLNGEARYHEVEQEIRRLARASEKSKGFSLGNFLIPQDEQIFNYLEAGDPDVKAGLASEMTAEQLDLAHYMQEYFAKALDYLIRTKSLEKGRQNYFVHMRRSVLETIKDDGLTSALKTVFKNYEQDELVFNILDGDTGNILPLNKFFQYSLRRSGELTPTKNVVKAFLIYAKTFEKKVALDEIMPKLDIYAQVLTPRRYTPKGLEIDRSLKKFLYQYINNKKGRKLGFDSALRQGGKVDITVRSIRAFVTILDLGFSIPVGVGSIVGEQMATYQGLGAKLYTLGNFRMGTKKGKAILEKYKAFTGRGFWSEFADPGKEITERLSETMFGFFHASSYLANKQFLLGSLTKEEYDSGAIIPERLAQIKVDLGRFRAVPGSKSLVGSTSVGGVATMYKSWAIPILRTTIKDVEITIKNLRTKPLGEALTAREAHELYRLVYLTAVVLIVLGAGDDDDKSFIGRMAYKAHTEALTLISALDPSFIVGTPRALGFLQSLAGNLKDLIMLKEYKQGEKRGQLVGAEKLKKQFTPGLARGILTEDKPKGR